MIGKKRGVTWWRAIWTSAVGTLVFVGLVFIAVILLGGISLPADADSAVLAFAFCFVFGLFACSAFTVRIFIGPPRIVAVSPPALSNEEKNEFKRRERRWLAILVSCISLLPVLELLPGVLVLISAPQPSPTVALVMIFLGLLAAVALLVGMAGLERVRRQRVEGPPLVDEEVERA